MFPLTIRIGGSGNEDAGIEPLQAACATVVCACALIDSWITRERCGFIYSGVWTATITSVSTELMFITVPLLTVFCRLSWPACVVFCAVAFFVALFGSMPILGCTVSVRILAESTLHKPFVCTKYFLSLSGKVCTFFRLLSATLLIGTPGIFCRGTPDHCSRSTASCEPAPKNCTFVKSFWTGAVVGFSTDTQ